MPINFANARFVTAAYRQDQLPPDDGIELAFAGRSNAGKSSVINRFCGRRKLARTSRTPGRTQELVVFELAPGLRFVDLPGFGYAKVAKTKREHWGREIPDYLSTRRSLVGLVLVADSRHALKAEEIEILHWCTRADLRVLLLLNKADKLNQQLAARSLRDARALIEAQQLGARCQLFSAATGRGGDQALNEINAWLQEEGGE